ncbi:MAG: uncharacterized protein QG622_810 [Actinomycetota bacterium]|nr:uncharacterized protein [Actinomycetota bacterium]
MIVSWAVKGASIVLVLVLMALVLLYGLQRSLVYYLDRTPAGTVADRIPGAEDVVLHAMSGLDLEAWMLKPSGTDRRQAVLYCPGNAGNRLDRLKVGLALASRGFTVLLLDYPGAGGNPGSPTEGSLVAGARAGAAYLKNRGFDSKRLIYVGESVGTGVAAELAALDPPAGVLLRSPFTSLDDVVTESYPFIPARVLLRDHFDSSRYLSGSDVPVRILCGSADDIVSPRLSIQLSRQVGHLQGLVVIPDAGHNDEIWFGSRLADEVTVLADSVDGP